MESVICGEKALIKKIFQGKLLKATNGIFAVLLLLGFFSHIANISAQNLNVQDLLEGVSGESSSVGLATDSGAAAAQLKPKPPKKITENMLKKPDIDVIGDTVSVDPGKKIDFQRLVERSVGKNLPFFGHDIFKTADQDFSLVKHGVVSPQYVINVGDEIIIRSWGQVDIEVKSNVSPQGNLFIPRVGQVHLAGVKYSRLESVVKAAVSKVYKNFELTAILGELHSIQVFVVGQVRRPGVYLLSARSTLISSLFIAGGAKYSGSLRNIQLKRGKDTVIDFDIYKLLREGDISGDLMLKAGDVIYVPPVGELAAISGGVNVPGIYEITMGTSVADLVQLAGGLASTASLDNISLERILAHRSRVVRKINTKSDGMLLKLRDGDLVNVPSISPKISNVVTLRGHVLESTRSPWHKNMSITDLIPEVSILVTPDFWINRNNLSRPTDWLNDQLRSGLDTETNSGVCLKLQCDEVLGNFVDGRGQSSQTLDYEVVRICQNHCYRNNTEQDYPVEENSSNLLVSPSQQMIDDLQKNTLEILKKSFIGAHVNWDYAVIERMDPTTLETELIPFNLGKAVRDKDPAHDLLLLPGDVVTVFSTNDVQPSIDKRIKYVQLDGEFSAPGIYQILKGETLSQLVARVGGVTDNAYLYGAKFYREKTRIKQQEQLDKAIVKFEAQVERTAAQNAATALSADDAASIKAQVEAQRALVKRLQSIKASGRIVLSETPMYSIYELPDLPLEGSDILHIPSRPGTVSVFGAVYNQNAFVYGGRRNDAKQYLSQAGGTTREADKKQIYILRANGSVESQKQSRWWNTGVLDRALLPGDALIVPEKVDQFSFSKELKDWSQILYQFALGVAGLKVLGDL